MREKNNNFIPTVAVAPGETIRDEMDFLGWDQLELATKLDIPTKYLRNILSGSDPITDVIAIKLERVLGPSAEFWMNLETNYQLDKSRLEEELREGL